MPRLSYKKCYSYSKSMPFYLSSGIFPLTLISKKTSLVVKTPLAFEILRRVSYF